MLPFIHVVYGCKTSNFIQFIQDFDEFEKNIILCQHSIRTANRKYQSKECQYELRSRLSYWLIQVRSSYICFESKI